MRKEITIDINKEKMNSFNSVTRLRFRRFIAFVQEESYLAV